MIKAIIVDDEANAIRNLKWEIEKFSASIEVSDAFTSPIEAISAINYLKPDCVFLDIEMPEMDGFQLLQNLKFRDFDLIITTAYDNYAVKAFKEHAVDYLLKPIDPDDLKRSVARIKKNKEKNELGFELREILKHMTPKPSKQKIGLPLSGKVRYILPEEILYCQSNGNYTEIYFKDAKKQMLSKKLKEVEQLINNDRFFRVHNSYFVNIDHIKEFVKSDGPYLVLDNKITIPVSRLKKDMLMDLLNRQ